MKSSQKYRFLIIIRIVIRLIECIATTFNAFSLTIRTYASHIRRNYSRGGLLAENFADSKVKNKEQQKARSENANANK